MQNVSNNFRNELNNDNRRYIKSCNIILTDGTVIPIDNSHIWGNGFKLEEAVSNSGSFDIGSAIAGKYTLVLNNIYDDFSGYDFTGAVISDIKIGLQLSDAAVEYVSKGIFTVDEQDYNGSIITLECLDNMSKFDRLYSESNLAYPATLRAIVQDACSCCGVSLAAGSATFDNDDYIVQTRPDDGSLTFRQVLLWVGQISCHWCRCDADGKLCLGWYDTALLERLWVGFDGGSFTMEGYHHIHSLASQNISTDDVVITGIKVVEKTDGEADTTYLYGQEGYILSIEGNDFIQGGKGQEVAEYLGLRLAGLRFRPLSVSCLSDPSLEAGDVAVVTDRKGKCYPTLITSTNFTAGSYQRVSCDAETPLRNSAHRFSEATRIYQDMRKRLTGQKSEWEKAVKNLMQTLDDSSGLYITPEKQDDGSSIYYMHNKSGLSESDIIWKITAEAFGISTDGGKTYPFGFEVTGEMVTKILNTIGINADWIRSGAFTVVDDDGNIIFDADKDLKRVLMSGDSVWIGGKTATEAVKEALEEAKKAQNLNVILDNEYQGIPTDHNGNCLNFPLVQTTVMVLCGRSDVSADCLYSIQKSDSVTGRWDETTRTYTVTALSADTGWVDITVSYMSMFTATKRFSVVKQKDGTPGINGVGVKSSAVEYQASPSGTEIPTGAWQNSIPSVSANQYLWTRTTVTYTDETSISSYSVGKIGANGENGKGIRSASVAYQTSSSGTIVPTGTWNPSVPAISEGRYLWTRTVITYTDDTTTTGYSVSRNGENGRDGQTYYTWIKYADTPTSGMSDSPDGKKYMGLAYNKTTASESTDYSDYTWSLIKGENGADGINGVNGKDGKTYYTWVKYADDANGRNMSDDPDGKEYIGLAYNKTTPTESSYASDYSWALFKGSDGVDGKGIESTTITYQNSSSGTSIPSGTWLTYIPTVSAGQYLWTRTVTTYSDNTVTTSYSVGRNGTNGSNGADGRGIRSTAVTYQASSSGTTAPAGVWATSPPTVNEGQYLWTKTVITYTDGTTSISYSVGKMGQNGEPGRTYFIELSANVLKRGQNNAVIPATITANAYYRDGTSAVRTAYAGRWKVQTSTNGTSWTTVYTSSANESYKSYSVGSLSTSVVSVRFVLYAAGGTTTQMDMQSVPIVIDVAALTHEQIFNLLTNNGAIKGIFKEGNQLYISFTYAKGGQLTLGGSNNGNGMLVILNASGSQVGYINNTGVHFESGYFSGEIESITGLIGGWVISDGCISTWREGSKDTDNIDHKDGIISLYSDGSMYAIQGNGSDDDITVLDTSSNYVKFLNGLLEARNARMIGNFLFNDYGGNARRPVGSSGTNGNRTAWVSTTNNSGTYSIVVNGQYGSTSAFSGKRINVSSSDIRLKENIRKTEVEALPVINQIGLYQFDWKQDHYHQRIGFVADYLERVDDHMAIGGGYDADGNMDEKSVNDFYLMGYAIKGIQELCEKVEYLEKENKQLKEGLQKVEQALGLSSTE